MYYDIVITAVFSYLERMDLVGMPSLAYWRCHDSSHPEVFKCSKALYVAIIQKRSKERSKKKILISGI